jgi:hypothetical protein
MGPSPRTIVFANIIGILWHAVKVFPWSFLLLVGVVLVPQKPNTSITLSHTADIHCCSHCSISHFLRRKSWCTNGLRFREETGRWVVDRRPQGYKKKLSLGSYKKKKDSLIAIDFCNFQTLKQPAREDFNYNCSPDLFSNLPCLRMDFQSLDPKCPDDAHCHYSQEMRERIDQLIRQDEEVHWTGWKYWIPMDNGNASGPSFPQLNFPLFPELDIIPESYTDIRQHVLEEPHLADFEGPSGLDIIPESCTGIHQHEPHLADSEGPSRLYIIPESYTDIHQHVLEELCLPDSEGQRGLLSNQWEAVVHNLPSHVERYDLADLIPGLPIETGAFLLGTVHLHPERQ